MSTVEREQMEAFLPGSITTGTEAGYAAKWTHWLGYLASLDKNSHPGEFLERAATTDDKCRRLVLFYRYLYELGLRAEQVTQVNSSVKFYFETAGYNTDFFSSAEAARGKVLHMKAQVQRQILPLGMEAILTARNDLWLKSSWNSREGMDKKGVWIAIGLGFDSGSRISNLCLSFMPHMLASPLKACFS